MIVSLIVLRIVHIVAGVLWVGGSVIHSVFIAPTARAMGPESQKFVQYLMAHRHYSLFMNLVSGLTVLAGALLYWRSSGGFQSAWILSGPGLMFTAGSIVGIVVYVIGFSMIRPRVSRMGALGNAIGAAGGVPTPEQVNELRRIDDQLTMIGWADSALLIVALAAMSIARYTWF